MEIHEFLACQHRFRWGGVDGDDCTTFCASWVAARLGIDPAEELRGSYRDADSAHAIIEREGGLVALFGGRLEALGFVPVNEAHDGDIGVVVAPSGIDGSLVEVGAIAFGPLWATLAPSGVTAKKLEAVAIWRMPA
ncbi:MULTISPECIES: hypothetical protein [unclassified Ensifer]|uniref:DUF6950 family protein n=1 Tax=unclassified Ensifer TaxID=2633371 RepID=UPI000714346A|nr:MULTISPECIES: hypothetical protein [unclassified Ensifer]KQZ41854.1 hypothetical protein ASD63_16790 [Ensifer sp. Root558]SFH29686.1 hypothetical protein SAMN05216459_12431 [Ensifer sp. OV372]